MIFGCVCHVPIENLVFYVITTLFQRMAASFDHHLLQSYEVFCYLIIQSIRMLY